jgi:hypothetical protein
LHSPSYFQLGYAILQREIDVILLLSVDFYSIKHEPIISTMDLKTQCGEIALAVLPTLMRNYRRSELAIATEQRILMLSLPLCASECL